MSECRHGLSEDCPGCARETIEALVKALNGLINAGNAAVGADPNDTEAAEAFEMWNIARRDARRALVGHPLKEKL